MIDAEIHAVLVKVAVMGLQPEKHLGKSLKQMQPILLKLNEWVISHLQIAIFINVLLLSSLQVSLACPAGFGSDLIPMRNPLESPRT